MNKKNILIAHNFPFGGASANLLRYFTFCLKDSKDDIEVFLPSGGFFGKKLDQKSNRIGFINGIRYQRLGFINHPNNILGKLIDNIFGLISPFFYLGIASFKNRLDSIILYDPTFLTISVILISKFLFNKKLIIIIPEYYEKPKTNMSSYRMLKWYNFYFGIKYLYKYADKFIVLSSYLKNYIEQKLNSTKNIMIMPNLVDPTKFHDIGNIKNYKNDQITVGYVGTPTEKDGIKELIMSIMVLRKKNLKIHLLIVGDITNGNTIIPELKSYASSIGLDDDNITFTGLVSHKEIPKLLLSCQILALTRPNGVFAEAGFPTKLGEYFACKKPIVLTKVGDLPVYFSDKKHVVFAKPEEIDSIVSAFEYIILNPIEANKIAMNGYNWMYKNLNYREQSKKISNFLSFHE